jgi:tRNA pseudouridine38-40 synthase
MTSDTRRVAWRIGYDGAVFHGFQRQDGWTTVQGVMEEVLSRLCDRPMTVWGAGRTDTGVHARGQVVHAEVPVRWDPSALTRAMRACLRPYPMAVWAWAVPGEGFHSRFSATGRVYAYRLATGPVPPIFDRHRCWHLPFSLNLGWMEEASLDFIGTHHFGAFRSVDCQSKRDCITVQAAGWQQCGPHQYEWWVRAPSFLHRMVRIMVGTLVAIGRGHRPLETVRLGLASGDRRDAGPTAPPHGLTLEEVVYATEILDWHDECGGDGNDGRFADGVCFLEGAERFR